MGKYIGDDPASVVDLYVGTRKSLLASIHIIGTIRLDSEVLPPVRDIVDFVDLYCSE